MKTKKLSGGMKFLITAMVVAMILVTSVGISSIFAEPTIEDLVPKSDFGAFGPNELYDGEEDVELAGWLNMTEITFSYDWWFDYSGNGEISTEDVYSQEGFEQEMLLGQQVLPIFVTEDDSDNYYIVSFKHYDKYNGVIAQFAIAENNDAARMKSADMYWFDGENLLLYINKELLIDDFEAERFNTIRAESVMLTKDIRMLTKDVNIITLFDAEIDNTYGLYSSTPNETIEYNVKEWLIDGVRYQLVPTNKLAHVSSEDITVYLNGVGIEYTSWEYNETDGTIVVYCDPYTTSDVVVKFNSVHDATTSQQTLQHFQTMSSDDVGQAATIQEVVTGNNPFLHYVKYEDQEPVVGTWQALGFLATVAVDSSGQVAQDNFIAGTVSASGNKKYAISKNYTNPALKESVPITTLIAEVNEHVKDLDFVDNHFQSTTLIAFDVASNRLYRVNYGNIVYNLFLAEQGKGKTSLDKAITYIEELLVPYDSKSEEAGYNYNHKALKFSWDCWHPFKHGTYDGRYIAGTMKTSFLGGTIDDEGGMAFFDATCATIEAPGVNEYNRMAGTGYDENGSWIAGTNGYRTRAIIVDTTKDATGGFLYICVHSDTAQYPGLVDEDGDPQHGQRVLAFSKVRYEFNGTGKIRLTKKDSSNEVAISGAEYTINSDEACTTVVETITTSNVPVESKDITAGTYYVKETKVPAGYLRDNTVHEVKVVGGETADLDVYDDRQQCEFTVTVYDQTTENQANKIPVPGVVFELYAPGNVYVGTYTTNSNGQLTNSDNTKFSVDATGRYVLRQVSTVGNYCMDTNSSSEYYCGGGTGLTIYANPTTDGVNIQQNIVHYEQRQEITIKSHVQDENLLEKTPDELGGDVDTKSYTSTNGSKYQLRTKSSILLGYHNGAPVTIGADQVLEIWTQDVNGSFYNDDDTKHYSTVAYSTNSGGKSYIIAKGVKDPVTGLTFPLPNGSYQWELLEASDGYYDNEEVTAVGATWKEDNAKTKSLTVSSYPVKQARQKAEITLYVKSYTAQDRKTFESSAFTNIIKENAYTSLKPRIVALQDASNKDQWLKFIKDGVRKTVKSNETSISQSSKEAVQIINGTETVYITSSGLVPNAVYELTNLGDIVVIDSGEIVKAGTPLGMYVSDSNGRIHIDSLGSEAFDNPNASSNSATPRFKAITPKTESGKAATGALPNGVYGLALVAPADGYLSEDGLSEDVVDGARWIAASSSDELLEVSTAVFMIKDDPKPGVHEPKIAPDVPVDEDDIYDPNNPGDDPTNPDDSNDITIVTTDWIDLNRYNLAYRIVDSENITGEGANVSYEVDDALPTTFAFYIDNELMNDDAWTYEYYLSFYYEIPQAEYSAASAEAKSNKEYISPFDGKYARRFATDALSGGEWLQDVIVLNQKSPGYSGYNEMKGEATISGAIYNTEWLNSKLAAQADGDYHIFVAVHVVANYTTKFSGQPMSNSYEQIKIATLEIKNRQLVNLD